MTCWLASSRCGPRLRARRSTLFDRAGSCSALERGVEIISEASRHIPDEVKAQHPVIPWPDVKAIGNHLRHGYERVDLDVIWKIATEDLNDLEPVLRKMLAEIENG